MYQVTLKNARLNTGMTVNTVSSALRVPSSTVEAWESGGLAPDQHELAQLSILYGVPVDYLAISNKKPLYDRLQRSAESAEILPRYDTDIQQLAALLDRAGHHDNETFQAIITAFQFGFSQGSRQTKNEAATAGTVTTSGANV